MGRDKTEVQLESQTLLERAVSIVRPLADRVLIVGKDVGPRPFDGIETHLDDHANAGPLGGIATALRLARPHPCLIIPCDMPMLSAGLLGRLIGSHGRDLDCTLLMNPDTGRPEPLVGVYAPSCLAAMAESIAAGRLAIWRTLAELRVRHVPVPAAQADQLVNLNTPNDVSGLEQLGT